MVLVADRPALLTPDEVATALRVNVRTVYRMIESGQLKAIKAGGQYRIFEDSLEKLLKGE